MKYTFNIGLHGTNYSKVIEQVNNARGTYFNDYHAKEMLGEYENEPEPTAVITLDTEADLVSMIGLTRQWLNRLNQTCIALEITASEIMFTRYPQTVNSSFGVLIYAEDYRGREIKFDSKYFLK